MFHFTGVLNSHGARHLDLEMKLNSGVDLIPTLCTRAAGYVYLWVYTSLLFVVW
jgi:hypothetical protein